MSPQARVIWDSQEFRTPVVLRSIEHLSHLLRPAIRNSDFDTEKKVILEEIAMYLDDPGHRVTRSSWKSTSATTH